MSDECIFAVAGKPAPKGSWQLNQSTGRMFQSNANAQRKWVKEIRNAAREMLVEPYGAQVPVRCDVLFVMQRGKTVKRPLPSVKPDIDKLLRTVYDALTGIAWVDDAQVCAGYAGMIYAGGRDYERVLALWDEMLMGLEDADGAIIRVAPLRDAVDIASDWARLDNVWRWCNVAVHPYLSLASGIGGLDLGVERGSGGRARAVCYVEREICAAAILAARMAEGRISDAPILVRLANIQCSTV